MESVGGRLPVGQILQPALDEKKYELAVSEKDGRLTEENPFGDSKFSSNNWHVLEALRQCANEMGEPVAKVALAWVARRPLVHGTLIGARTRAQLEGNLAALDLVIPDDQLAVLENASDPEPPYPTSIFSPRVKRLVFGGAEVMPWK